MSVSVPPTGQESYLIFIFFFFITVTAFHIEFKWSLLCFWFSTAHRQLCRRYYESAAILLYIWNT